MFKSHRIHSTCWRDTFVPSEENALLSLKDWSSHITNGLTREVWDVILIHIAWARVTRKVSELPKEWEWMNVSCYGLKGEVWPPLQIMHKCKRGVSLLIKTDTTIWPLHSHICGRLWAETQNNDCTRNMSTFLLMTKIRKHHLNSWRILLGNTQDRQPSRSKTISLAM